MSLPAFRSSLALAVKMVAESTTNFWTFRSYPDFGSAFGLVDDALGYWFRIDKLWELRNGVAAPMDQFDQGLAQAGRSRFTGMDEATFLSAVRDAVKRVGAQR